MSHAAAPATPLTSPPALRPGARAERIGDEIARLSAHIEAATGRLLDLIRDFDASEEWYAQGFRSCALWLSWRIGIGPGAARERVRVARALGRLPAMNRALATGELSYSLARALTRVATPENEAGLIEAARHTTAADMERLVATWQVADRAEAGERERQARRYLRLVVRPDGSWRLDGDLAPDVGAAFNHAIETCCEHQYRQGDEGSCDEPYAARRADALDLLTRAAMGGGLTSVTDKVSSGGVRPEIVVHVSAETLESDGDSAAEPDRVPKIEGGPHVSAETSRRLACDAGVVKVTHDADGSVLDVGRRRRTIPAAIRRALVVRDDGCRFPGCPSRFCDAHHLRHWADGGRTSLRNLVLLCRHHHRRVHEDGWRVTLGESGDVRFRRPDGTPVPEVPARPPAPVRPARALRLVHERANLEIDEWTATPRWLGDRLDTDWALFVLRPPAVPPANPNVSAETFPRPPPG